MSSPDFAFIPRKLSKPARSTGDATKAQRASNHDARILAEHAASSSFTAPKEGTKGEKHLDDSSYANLFELALSEHTLWSDHELLEALETNESFVPISYLIQSSPFFAGLLNIPPVSDLIRSIRASNVLEGRLALTDIPSRDRFGKTRRNVNVVDNEDLGFEVRRKDLGRTKERVRRYSSFHWDSRTVYVENLPHRARTFHSVYDFMQQLLANRLNSEAGTPPIQSISFPAHHKDNPGAPPPTVGKGFAFVVLSSPKDVDYLLERWPWQVNDRRPISRDDESSTGKIEREAVEHGFRCLSKRRWDELKEEYLALQRLLLERTLAANAAAGPSTSKSKSLQLNVDNASRTRAEDRRAKPSRDSNANGVARLDEHLDWFPRDCLVFAKNVHPETNKTTLRTFFASAFDKDTSPIDYVDYNKGLDSCYLRLSDPQSAQSLVSYFSEHKIVQAGALDNAGVPLERVNNGVTLIEMEVELVQGRKAELYWEKVPEKIRKAAIGKAQARAGKEAPGKETSTEVGGERKRKRRKRG